MPIESSKWRRPRIPATIITTSSPANGLMRDGSPSSVTWTGTPLSSVPVDDARAVELRVEPGHAFLVARADRPAGARPALVLRLVHDVPLEVAAADHLHVAVVHAAGVALMAAVIEALAELRRLPVGQLVVGAVGRVVLDGQRAELAEVHAAGQRAVR